MATQCGEEGGVMRSDVQGEVCVPAAGLKYLLHSDSFFVPSYAP